MHLHMTLAKIYFFLSYSHVVFIYISIYFFIRNHCLHLSNEIELLRGISDTWLRRHSCQSICYMKMRSMRHHPILFSKHQRNHFLLMYSTANISLAFTQDFNSSTHMQWKWENNTEIGNWKWRFKWIKKRGKTSKNVEFNQRSLHSISIYCFCFCFFPVRCCFYFIFICIEFKI